MDTLLNLFYKLFLSLLLSFFLNCLSSNIQRGNSIEGESFGEIIFQFKSTHSKLSHLNPKITFKGSVDFDLNSEFSPILYNEYDFIIDLKLQDLNSVSLKLKPGSYYGFFEINNTEIKPLWISRFSFQQIYFGYDPKKYNGLVNKNVEYYSEKNCTKNTNDKLICPKIEIEANRKYIVQLQLEEELFDGKSTSYLWLGTPFLPAVAIGVIPPNILVGTIAYKQEISIKVNQNNSEK